MKLTTMLCSLAMVLSTPIYAQTQLDQITGIVLNEDGQPVVHALRVFRRWDHRRRNAACLPIKVGS